MGRWLGRLGHDPIACPRDDLGHGEQHHGDSGQRASPHGGPHMWGRGNAAEAGSPGTARAPEVRERRKSGGHVELQGRESIAVPGSNGRSRFRKNLEKTRGSGSPAFERGSTRAIARDRPQSVFIQPRGAAFLATPTWDRISRSDPTARVPRDSVEDPRGELTPAAETSLRWSAHTRRGAGRGARARSPRSS
jgi:hypothetical protein